MEYVSYSEQGILEITRAGLFCRAGGFHIDPWKPVPLAVITHAHSDHARSGMEGYICSGSGESLLRQRVGRAARIEAVPFGQVITVGDVELSLHPAGHILGSSQVRMAVNGEVIVVTGDHNASHVHGAAETFEPVACDTLITECTFGLPVYQWPDPAAVMEEIHRWWKSNRDRNRTSILPCYPLGKTQRILSELDPDCGPIAVSGSARPFIPMYKAAGVRFPTFLDLTEESIRDIRGGGLVLVSFAGKEPPLLERLQPLSQAVASGWMRIRGVRRSRNLDRGFVLSDHSDWNGLLRCILESGATRVGLTHGQTEVLSRYLREEHSLDSFTVPTRFSGDSTD